MEFGLSGLASGFDWKSLISQLMQVERAPETRMRSNQDVLDQQNNAFGSIRTQLTVLQSRVKDLSDPNLFDSRSTQSTDEDVATATAAPGATAGTYEFNVTQMATSSRRVGKDNVANGLHASDVVSDLVLANAGFSTKITAGVFTINGKQISVSTTDTLADVFSRIASATGGAVDATYNPLSDKIELASSDEIVLGSGTDTSNFLQVTKLHNNGSGAVLSSSALGGANLTNNMVAANLTTAINDGGAGAGEFKINGVSINFNASQDSIQNVLDRINSSAAGVTANYDALNDRFVLSAKEPGDVGISLENVHGNFLTATGLMEGSLVRGKDLQYSINGGPTLTSHSNIVTETSSGLAGLNVTALKEGSVTITVNTDTQKIKTAVKDFISEYNKIQSLISSQTSSSTDAKGKVTAGILAGDAEANGIASKLRSLSYSPVSGISATIRGLSALGIDTNGNDNSLELADEEKLDSALAENLDAVKQMFTDADSGIAVQLKDYLDRTLEEDGILSAKQNNLVKQSGEIDKQIAELERQLTEEQKRLTSSFVAMETAQQNINQQLQYLQQRFG